MSKINDINALELEIERTKLHIERVEMRLDQNLAELRSNYWLLAINSILGVERKEKIFTFFEKIGDKLMEKLM